MHTETTKIAAVLSALPPSAASRPNARGAQLARGYPKAPASFLNETAGSQAITQHTLAQVAADVTEGRV